MKGVQIKIEGDWGHFKRPETNNNPLSHDLIPKTALIGMVGAVLGIERHDMKSLFPVLSEDLLYGVSLLSPVKKISWGFTSKTAINPTGSGSPKYFEILKDPTFLVSIALYGERSMRLFDMFQLAVEEETSIFTPVLGWHNCPANLSLVSIGDFSEERNGIFSTNGFVLSGIHVPQNISEEYRIGFDRIPTYQNDDFWNLPEKYVDIIYPDSFQSITVEGPFYEYNSKDKKEKWCLI